MLTDLLLRTAPSAPPAAGTLLAILPLLVVFLVGARHFITSIADAAVKG